MNLPNALTWLRVILIPVVVGLMCAEPIANANAASAAGDVRVWAAGLFAIAGITDWLDGYLARRWDQQTAMGAFLDPVADKLMVCSVLIVLCAQADGWLIGACTLIIVLREIAISALREFMASRGARDRVAVSWAGKVKTTVQILALIALLYAHPVAAISSWSLGLALLVASAVLTLFSMFDYVRAAWPVLNQGPK